MCVYVGTADEHPKDTYRFYDLKTDRIILSRDIQWQNVMYGDWKSIRVGNNIPDEDWDDEPLNILSDDPEPLELTQDEDVVTTLHVQVTDDEDDNQDQENLFGNDGMHLPVETTHRRSAPP